MKLNRNPGSRKDEDFFNLSEQLRELLEIKLEELFKDGAGLEASTDINPECLSEEEENMLILFLTAFKDYDRESANKIVRAIRTWFNMYYDDRLSVLEKFKNCYENDMLLYAAKETNSCLLFCRLFIKDLSSLLNNGKWAAIEKLD